MARFNEGQKVKFKGKTYDFGYYSAQDGYVVLYEEGERNMQDSFAVRESEVTASEKRVLNIESQICDTEAAFSYLSALINIAAEAGYTHVHDHWGHKAWDEYTIAEAQKQFCERYVEPEETEPKDEDDLPF